MSLKTINFIMGITILVSLLLINCLIIIFSVDEQGETKPVFVATVDGGPDENPRYRKVIDHAIDHFKKCNLDALFLITNAPGRSAYNRVERRMAPLSRQLSGLILPHNNFGTHLNEASVTIDHDLEKKNFGFAGKALAEVWGNMDINGYPVTAEYADIECVAQEPEPVSAKWFSVHVQESQYFLQVMK